MLCSLCDEVESMDHILFRCTHGTGRFIWPSVREMCEQKGMDWPQDFDIFTILACPFERFEDTQGNTRPGANPLFQIAVSEAAFVIWKLRCKRKFNRVDDARTRKTDQTSESETVNTLAYTLNGRVNDDRRLTYRKRYGKKALTPSTG